MWDSLGYAEHHMGNLGEAAACYQHALSLHREAGDRFTEAEALAHLGETCQAAGKFTHARDALTPRSHYCEDATAPTIMPDPLGQAVWASASARSGLE